MKTFQLAIMAAISLLISSCNGPEKRLPTIREVTGDTIPHVDSTVQVQERMMKESEKIRDLVTPSKGPYKDQLFTEGQENTRLADAIAGEGPRYTFTMILYRYDGDYKDRMWLSGISELSSFTEDDQARFMDRCTDELIREGYNRPIKVTTRTAFMSFRYAVVSEWRVELQKE